ncbi:hypothetical protein BC829DRAFT_419867 [Chytridium lagenaria]|nr:hypothetical protein BC829DRAFT_419867 [Chytridium lagenaria]
MDARSAATEVFTAEYVRKVLRDGRRASEMVHCLSSGRPFEEESFAAVPYHLRYSSFTSSMSVYGKIASEVVTEEVGTYIKKILEIVDNHNGDVVKFLGDAILVTFESRTDELPKDVVTRGMMCCLDVMLNCSNFKVKGTPALWKIIMASSKDQPDRKVDDVYTSIVGSIYSKSGSTRARPSRPSLVPGTEMHHMGGKRESSLELGDPLSKSTNRSRISLEFAPEPTTGFYIQELKLHTAITVGDIRHTIIGIPAERLDYFIDGGCLHYLFESLAAAKAGGVLALRDLFSNQIMPTLKVKHRPLGKLPPLNTANPISEHNSVHLFAKFVNAAVLRRMRFDADSNVQELPHQMGDLNTIDQSGSRDIKGLKEFRRISVVFIKLGATFNIKDVQKLITVFLQCIKMSQGVFQQFSVDDKGKSFLAFFGLPEELNFFSCLPSTTSGILCDENTWNTVRDTSFSYFGRIYVKGRDGPVNVWERVSTDIRRSMGTEIKSEHVGYEQERDMVLGRMRNGSWSGREPAFLSRGKAGYPLTVFSLIQGSEIESWTPFYAISNLLSYFYKNREILDTNLESRDRASSLLETRSLSLPRRNSTARRTFDEASFSNLISLMKCIGETDEAAIEIADLLPNLGRQRKDATLINKERSASNYAVLSIVIIIDDAQAWLTHLKWMDPVSVEILEAMMQDSDKIFCLLLSRPLTSCQQNQQIILTLLFFVEISERGGLRPLFASLLVDRIISCESEWAIDAEGQLCIESGLLQAILEPGISSIVIMQFDRLDPRLQDLLKVSSVLGHYFDIADGVALMANKCAMSVEAWIQFAIDNDTYQFLVKDANNQSFGDHYFRHSFISDAIYESIAYSERETLHARAAEHFEGFLNESNRAFLLPIVSFHYSKSSIMAKNILPRGAWDYTTSRVAFTLKPDRN